MTDKKSSRYKLEMLETCRRARAERHGHKQKMDRWARRYLDASRAFDITMSDFAIEAGVPYDDLCRRVRLLEKTL